MPAILQCTQLQLYCTFLNFNYSLYDQLAAVRKQNFRWAQTPTQCQQVINQVYLIFRFDEDKWGTCTEVTWCIKAC